ncbi:glycosyltransferase family 2 protein [Alkalibacterium sp. MB6]|uniref:glycosyltransferase family 2 protein n=1 Tax=Alkalibacterium sp. MB6 TaxID=2081965 RepID=UPI001379D21C|nr:glycosyltransferase family 2 protein [Alkalibacterium sp. MB6]
MIPKVSVIIPVYNGEESIFISLDSLLKQTYPNFEVVIIDDGSKDGTREVVEKFVSMDSRFKYNFKTNGGVSTARNIGLKVSQGEYVCFLDSDDFYENSFIEKMLNKIERELADVCYCGYNIVSPRGKNKKRTRFKSGEVLVDYILGKISIHTTGWMIRKKIISEFDIKFLEGVSWGEDFEFFCEVLAKTNKTTYVKDYLTNYRVDFEENRLSAFSLDKIDKDFESIQRIVNNTTINKTILIEKALKEYRLPALLIYRLNRAIEDEMNMDNAIILYNKYKNNFDVISLNNGLRSIKLIMTKLKLSRLTIKTNENR